MQTEWGGNPTDFETEEERKKRLAAERAALGMNAAQGAVPNAVSNFFAPTPSAQTQQQPQPSLWSATSNQIQTVAKEAAQSQTSAASGPNADPIQAYWNMARQLGGQQAAGKRLQTIKHIWDTYMAPYNGAGAIANLFQSSYSTDQIEDMAKAGHLGMFASGYLSQPVKVPSPLVSALGLDPNNPTHTAAVAVRTAAQGYLPSAPSVTQIPQLLPSKLDQYLQYQEKQSASYLKGAATPYAGAGGYTPEQLPFLKSALAPSVEPLQQAHEQAQDQWFTEWAGTGPQSLTNLVKLTGLSPSDYGSWGDYDVALQNWKGDQKFSKADQFDHLYDQMVQDRMKYINTNHAQEEANFQQQGTMKTLNAIGTGLLYAASVGNPASIVGGLGIAGRAATAASAVVRGAALAGRTMETKQVLSGVNQAWGGNNQTVQNIINTGAQAGYMLAGGAALGGLGEAVGAGGNVAKISLGIKALAGLESVQGAMGLANAGVQAMNAPKQIKQQQQLQQEVTSAEANPVQLPGAQQQLDNLMSGLQKLDPKSNQEMWNWIQSDQKDANGNVLIPGFGTDMEWPGAWTNQAMQAAYDKFAAQKRYSVEIQRQLIEGGYADASLPIDGNLDPANSADPRWTAALKAAQNDINGTSQFSSKYPVLAKVLQTIGTPLTKAGWDAKEKLMFQYGPLQGLFSNLLMGGEMAGGLYNAAMSSLTYGESMLSDKTYNDLKDQYSKALQDGSADADAIGQKLVQRKAWLLQNTFVPDAIMQASIPFGRDVDSAVAWNHANPGLSVAADMGRDAMLAFVMPGIKNTVSDLFTPARDFDAAVNSGRFQGRMNDVVTQVTSGKAGAEFLAAQSLGKTADSSAVVRQVSNLYNGKLAGKAYQPIAEELLNTADQGGVSRIQELTNLDQSGAQALAGKLQAIQPKEGAADPAQSRLNQASRVIANAQKADKNFLNMKQVGLETGARAWADGKSIMPDLVSHTVSPASDLHARLLNVVGTIKDDSVREFASDMMRQVEIQGSRQIDIGNNMYNADRVFYSALAAYHDVGTALEKASEWVRNPSPVRRLAIGQEISDALNSRYDLTNGSSAEFTPRETALGVNPAGGGLLGEDTTAIPTYLRYTADMGRQDLAQLAPYKILDDWSTARQVATKYLINPSRWVERGLSTPSNFLRRWTVALGPMLAVKHSVADTSRSLLESPGSILNAAGEAKGIEARLATVDPETANQVRYQKAVNEASLAHYYGHNTDIQADFNSAGDQIYKANTKTGKMEAVNMQAGSDALRRIATDPVYRAWVDGGEEGVRAYLHTSAGHEFMVRSGIQQAFEGADGGELLDAVAFLGDHGEIKTKYDAAAQYYIDHYAKPLFGGLEQMAPKISDGLAQMARGERPATSKEVKSLLDEVNGASLKAGAPVENPYLSVADPSKEPMAQLMVGKLMTANRLNRNALWNRLFNKAFDSAVKDGVGPTQAAVLSMDVARLGSSRIHFDLANAVNFESQHRWAAWFATKHRLYNTYLFRTLVSRPSIAGAAEDLANYFSQRNSDPTIPEYDKDKLIINLDKMPGLSQLFGKVFGSSSGNELRLDLSTLWWLNEATQESAFGQLAETLGAKLTHGMPGIGAVTNYAPTLSTFGLSTGRWDQVVGTAAVAIPIWLKAQEGLTTDQFNTWLKGYLDNSNVPDVLGYVPGISAFTGAMDSLKKAMDVHMALAMHNGITLTPGEAAVSAATQGFLYQVMQMGKLWPGRVVFGSDNKYSKLISTYNQADPATRVQMLNENPDLRFMFGVYSTNPVDQMQIVQGFQRYAEISKEQSTALYNALMDGSIYDKANVDAIFNKYDDLRNQVTDKNWHDKGGNPSPYRNDTFASFINGLGGDLNFAETMHAIFPLADPRLVTVDGYVPDDSQQKLEKQRLDNNFDTEVRNAGYDPSNYSSYPSLIWMHKDLVDDPYNAFMKGQTADGWTTALEKTVADELAQGQGGPNARTQFLTELHRQDLMQHLTKGTVGNAKAGVSGVPMMATLSTEDKQDLGWNSTRDVENIWRLYCSFYDAQTKYMEENGISPTSKAAKSIRDALGQWAVQQGDQNQEFQGEWEFSHMSADQRLSLLKIDTPDTPQAQGWSEFLGIVGSYRSDLAHTYNKTLKSYGIGPTAQAAYAVQAKYWPEIEKLKKENPKWWNQLMETFGGLNKFGFVHWKPPVGQYTDLFLGQEDTDAFATDYTSTEVD